MRNKDTLKVGDKIFYSSKWDKHIETIVRETKTMFIAENNRIRIYKKDNRIVGEHYTYARLAVQEDYDMFKKMGYEKKIIDFDFSLLSLVEMEIVINLINGRDK